MSGLHLGVVTRALLFLLLQPFGDVASESRQFRVRDPLVLVSAVGLKQLLTHALQAACKRTDPHRLTTHAHQRRSRRITYWFTYCRFATRF